MCPWGQWKVSSHSITWLLLPFIPMTSHSYHMGHNSHNSHPLMTKNDQKLVKTHIFDFFLHNRVVVGAWWLLITFSFELFCFLLKIRLLFWITTLYELGKPLPNNRVLNGLFVKKMNKTPYFHQICQSHGFYWMFPKFFLQVPQTVYFRKVLSYYSADGVNRPKMS